MNTIYIGVDFHAQQQTICYLTTETGELVTTELKHEPKTAVRTFYEQFSGLVIVGLEASGYSPWFERLLEELGHQVWVGDATEIRRRAPSYADRNAVRSFSTFSAVARMNRSTSSVVRDEV